MVADNIDRDAEIRSLANDVGPDGSFHYSFETSNGIAVNAQGNADAHAGSASWVSPEGTPVSISYTADENGYVATGDFVPKTPEYVLRAIEYIKAHPSQDEYSQQPQQQQQQQPQQQPVPQRRF